jgi:hypothetical protein
VGLAVQRARSLGQRFARTECSTATPARSWGTIGPEGLESVTAKPHRQDTEGGTRDGATSRIVRSPSSRPGRPGPTDGPRTGVGSKVRDRSRDEAG